MPRTKTPTFRPTVWPAEPPQAPRVRAFRLVEVERTGLLEVAEIIGDLDLPPDFVLRELLEDDFMPTSLQDVAALTATWGLAGGIGSDTTDQWLPDMAVMAWRALGQDYMAEIERWEREDVSARLVHPLAVARHVMLLRAMARHLLAYLEGQGDEAIVAAWEGVLFKPVKTARDAWLLWEMFMNAGLAAYTVHVRAIEIDGPAVGTPRGGLYSACCLQLANYLTGEASVSRCANERCRRPFTRQRGRAREEYGQHRSRGVRYCSHLCAKAQSERDRRRRRAKENEQ